MDRPTEAFKQAQHDANATYYCDCYHGPKAVQAIIVYAEHLESKVERLREEREQVIGTAVADSDKADAEIEALRAEVERLTAKLERVMELKMRLENAALDDRLKESMLKPVLLSWSDQLAAILDEDSNAGK